MHLWKCSWFAFVKMYLFHTVTTQELSSSSYVLFLTKENMSSFMALWNLSSFEQTLWICDALDARKQCNIARLDQSDMSGHDGSLVGPCVGPCVGPRRVTCRDTRGHVLGHLRGHTWSHVGPRRVTCRAMCRAACRVTCRATFRAMWSSGFCLCLLFKLWLLMLYYV